MRVVGIYWTIGDSASSRVKLDWIAPQVVAVQFNEVEGVEEYALVSALVTDEIEEATPLSSSWLLSAERVEAA